MAVIRSVIRRLKIVSINRHFGSGKLAEQTRGDVVHLAPVLGALLPAYCALQHHAFIGHGR